MVFEFSCKKLAVGSALLSCLYSADAESNDFYSTSFGECHERMSSLECHRIHEKNTDRALNYFTAFVSYKSAEYILDETGYLPITKSIIHLIDDIRSIDTVHGIYYYGGDKLQVKDFMGVKDSYLEVKLGLDSSFKVDEFKLQYSVRF
jgi:hypothetical protein